MWAESQEIAPERLQGLSLRDVERSKPWCHPGPHLSPSAVQVLDLLHVCCSAPGLRNSPHLGRPAGLRGSPNSHKQCEQAGKHHGTHSQWAVLLAFGYMPGHCDSHVARKTLITQQGQESKTHAERQGIPCHHRERSVHRPCAHCKCSGHAGHTHSGMDAQHELSCPARSRTDKATLAEFPSSGLTLAHSAVTSEHFYMAALNQALLRDFSLRSF